MTLRRLSRGVYQNIVSTSLQYSTSEVVLSIGSYPVSSLGEIRTIQVSYAKSSVDVIVHDRISGITPFSVIM